MIRKTAHPATSRLGHLVLPGLGVPFLVSLVIQLRVNKAVGLLVDAGWSLVPILLLYSAHQIARAAALLWCVPNSSALSLIEALRIRLSGEAIESLTLTGPMISEPAKARLLQRTGLELSKGLAATLTEYVASTVAAAVSLVLAVSYILAALHPEGALRAAAAVVLSATSAFLLFVTIVVTTRAHPASAILKRVTHRTAPAVHAVEDALIRVPRDAPGRLMAIMSAEFAAQAMLGLELWALLLCLHLPCSPARALLMEGMTKVNAVAFFIPGQLGVAEGSYAVMFSVFGLPAAAGVLLSCARRVRTLITAVVGLLALMAVRNRGEVRT